MHHHDRYSDRHDQNPWDKRDCHRCHRPIGRRDHFHGGYYIVPDTFGSRCTCNRYGYHIGK